MAKFIIVGGVAGGATTAARLRRLDEKAEIIIFERGAHVSYANCGLPYYIGGTISDREQLFLQTPEGFKKRFNITVKINSEVTKINRTQKTVLVHNSTDNETYEESYDKLILSPGAEPLRPPIPGIDSNKIFTLRNVPDTDNIADFIKKNTPRRAVIVGAGFIGLEMAENLHQRGIFVTIVELANQVMAPLDYEMAAVVHQHLKIKGVEFYLNDGVDSFKDQDDRIHISLKSGKLIPADIVILSIGVKPDSILAKNADLELGQRGAIVVDKYLQTSDASIYALGDAIEFPHPILGSKSSSFLAGPANRQGRILADNLIKEKKTAYKGAIITGIAKVFDITVATTGVSSKALTAARIDHIASITHSASHAGYYPGAVPLTMKIVFTKPDGKLLGAQVVGYDGVDKRIDLLAAVLKQNGTIYDLQELEHAYAPPFSSAKDPVSIAGYAAENILDGTLNIIHWDAIPAMQQKKALLVDVRTSEEYELGTIENALNIPVDDLRSKLDTLPQNRPIVLICAVGLRAYIAYRILIQNGFKNISSLSGGYKTYSLATDKQSNEDIYEDDFICRDGNIYQADIDSEAGNRTIETVEIDACGLQCPGPIIRLKEEVDAIAPGNRVQLTASDPGFYRDAASWCNITGNKLIDITQEKGRVTATIEKPLQAPTPQHPTTSASHKTMVVFSADLDKALAAFVIANGAAAMGKQVTMFFTFWGLSIIRDPEAPAIDKDMMGKMFGQMLPNGSDNLKLSKMNFGGAGTKMMKSRMLSLNIDPLTQMITAARKSGIKMLACQMSMDMMGIKAEELLDDVEIGGVATYLEETEKSNLNLFI